MKNMDVLTKEQKEYIDLSNAMDRMQSQQPRIGAANVCVPKLKEDRIATYSVEYDHYLFIECMEGKHNDFLQSIIDKTKE